MTDNLLELNKQYSSGQEKFVYFILAASASAIAYALNRAENVALSYTMIPLGISLLLWGLSFLFGSLHQFFTGRFLYFNMASIAYEKWNPTGEDKLKEKSEELSKINARLKKYNKRVSIFGLCQSLFFLAGAISYTTWQILRMSLEKVK